MIYSYTSFILVWFAILEITVLVFVAALYKMVSKETTTKKRLISAIIVIFLLMIFTFVAYAFHQLGNTLVTRP
jgi:hypothetical protein